MPRATATANENPSVSRPTVLPVGPKVKSERSSGRPSDYTWRSQLRGRLVPWGGLLAVVAVVLYAIDVPSWIGSDAAGEMPVTASAHRTSMPIVIVAGGELQSAQGVNVNCEL